MICQVLNCNHKATEIACIPMFSKRGDIAVAIFLCIKHGIQEEKAREEKS